MTEAMDVSRPRRYFALHYILLRFLGLGWWHHPDENDTRNFEGWYLYYAVITELFWVVGFVGLETIDPFIGDKDLDRFMFSLAFVITHDLTIIKLAIFFLRNREIQEIVRILEIDLQEYYQNNAMNRRTIKITRIISAAFFFFGWLTIANATVYGIIQDVRWKRDVSLLNASAVTPSRNLPQPIYIPWPYQTERSYVLTFLLETIGILWTGHIVMTIDTFIGSVILHMSCQFAILQEAFITAYDRTIGKLFNDIADGENNHVIYSIDTNDCETDRKEILIKKYKTEKQIEEALEDMLKSCFKQHQLLIR